MHLRYQTGHSPKTTIKKPHLFWQSGIANFFEILSLGMSFSQLSMFSQGNYFSCMGVMQLELNCDKTMEETEMDRNGQENSERNAATGQFRTKRQMKTS